MRHVHGLVIAVPDNGGYPPENRTTRARHQTIHFVVASGVLERESELLETYLLGGAGWRNFAASIATFVSIEVSCTSERPSVHVVMT